MLASMIAIAATGSAWYSTRTEPLRVVWPRPSPPGGGWFFTIGDGNAYLGRATTGLYTTRQVGTLQAKLRMISLEAQACAMQLAVATRRGNQKQQESLLVTSARLDQEIALLNEWLHSSSEPGLYVLGGTPDLMVDHALLWRLGSARDAYVRRNKNAETDGTMVRVPLWALMAAFGLPFVWGFGRLLRRRILPGHCPTCGYDLRATSDRCPECGHVPTVASPDPNRATPPVARP